MKTIGIIGGLGPETTSKFYLELIYSCQKINKDARPTILIYSIPIPYAVEEDEIVRGIGAERLVPLLKDAARNLEKAGADFLVMPCNSLHAFIEEIRNSVKIPVLSILEESTKTLKKDGVSKIGILSTQLTRNRKLYEKIFAENNITSVLPSVTNQQKLNNIIINLVMGNSGAKDLEELKIMTKELIKDGSECILLACTDLQLLKLQDSEVKIYDTLHILANASVEYMLSQ